MQRAHRVASTFTFSPCVRLRRELPLVKSLINGISHPDFTSSSFCTYICLSLTYSLEHYWQRNDGACQSQLSTQLARLAERLLITITNPQRPYIKHRLSSNMGTDICLPVAKNSHATGVHGNTIQWTHILSSNLFIILKGSDQQIGDEKLMLRIVQANDVLVRFRYMSAWLRSL